MSPDETYGRDQLKLSQMKSTKEEAHKHGHSHYIDWTPCRNGHIAPRTVRGECNQCIRDVAINSARRKKHHKTDIKATQDQEVKQTVQDKKAPIDTFDEIIQLFSKYNQ